MPMPLEVPDPRGLEGLAVFRSRRVEDGRERYRLHLGYFDSRTDAEDTLPLVQKHFPSAWVASAPRSGLGSLDDTNLSEFRLIRSPALMAAELEARSAAPVAPAQNAQRYVVQLSWSDSRVDTSDISQLAIFQAYALYTVTLARAGIRYYGIRLGFFTSAISARQVALYVRSEFPDAAVVPISEREYTRSREMIAQRSIRATPKVVTEAAPESPGGAESIAIEAPSQSLPDASAPAETAQPISVAAHGPEFTQVELREPAPIQAPDATSFPVPEPNSPAAPADSIQVSQPEPETSAQAGVGEPTAHSVVDLPVEPSTVAPAAMQAEATSAIAPPDPAETASPPTAETDTESPAFEAPPRPFTEVYVAEAAARLSARVQTHPLTRDEGIGGLDGEDLRGNQEDHRSALARLLHRLADRLS
jgi:hypothetical protein